MSLSNSLHLSNLLLTAMGTRMFVDHADRIPRDRPILVVSNHRSFMDALVLMAALNRPIRFACHHYMGQVPVLRQVVESLGCFPLDAPQQRQHNFFERATKLLQNREAVGVFPEGAKPMVQNSPALEVGQFHRGFAHLALRAPIPDLVVLPVAIAATEEQVNSTIPLKLLSFFDPSEPLFDQPGLHPMVIYQRVHLVIGKPYWMAPHRQANYQGKQAKKAVTALTDYCHDEISQLLFRFAV